LFFNFNNEFKAKFGFNLVKCSVIDEYRIKCSVIEEYRVKCSVIDEYRDV
jgi:hypothetical protein